MMDISALRRRAGEGLTSLRPTLISFSIAATGFIVAGIYLLTPGLAQGSASPSLFGELARTLAVAFGPASVVLCLIAAMHGLLGLLGRELEFDRARILYSGAMVVLLPCFLHLLAEAGGIIGLLAGDAITLFLPTWFALLLIGAASLLVVIRSTDWLFYSALREAKAPRPDLIVTEPEVYEPDEEDEEDWEYEEEEEEEEEEPEEEDEEFEEEEEDEEWEEEEEEEE
ncbi:MAG: hypothetical protein AAGD14_16095, partial [Planctomycetota bacterium]